MPRSFRAEILRRAHFFNYNIRPFRPSMVARHAWKRALSSLGLRSGFRVIDLAISYQCNLRCEHCSALVMEKDKPTLGLQDYRRIVTQARQLDNLSWNITGGEPLLVEELEDIVAVLDPSRHYISLQTNCTMLTEERARRLARAGVNCITTSLDSAIPLEHDEFRGLPGAFEKTIAGIKNARRAGMRVLIGGTVTHQNLRSEGIEQLIRTSNDLGAIFLFNLAIPCGNWKGREDVVLRGDDREYLFRLMAKYPRSTTDHEVGRNAVGCPAGTEKVYITPYGEVIPCPFIHISFGNVLETPLRDIVEKMRKVPQFGTYPKICVAAEDLDFHRDVFSRVYAPGRTEFPVRSEEIYGKGR